MNYLSVCSGIEAATVAWHHMGWNPLGFSEIEKFPSEVLKHHYPNVPNLGDMTKYKEWDFGSNRLDLLVGGTPCQSFSVAGLRKGLEDPRGNLALTYVGILDKFRPKWCVWENVPGVLSSNGGKDFGSFLSALVELRYGFAYRVLDAQYFGVAQRRRRVFVVGCLGDWRSAAEVLFESESLSRNIKPSSQKKQETSAFTTSSFGSYSTGVGTIRATGGDLGGGSETLYVPNLANCLQTTCNDYSRADGFNVIAMQGNLIGRDKGGPNGIGISELNTMYTLTKTDVHAIAHAFKPELLKRLGEIGSKELCPTLLANMDDNQVATAFGWQNNVNQSMSVNLITPTLDKSKVPALFNNMVVRKLTPVECERLQGFPEGYTDIKPKNKATPDGPRYKALGNSMAVPVMKWIGERINDKSK
jgi:DNA (cytosine-5)-methyltransferase 1